MRKKINIGQTQGIAPTKLGRCESCFSPVNKIIKAFTLVELIVVITILAILATIGFVSFSGYLAGTRDTNRKAQLKSMSDALELYRTKKDLPIPDDKVDVKVDGEVIAYQGYIGKNVLETIEYTESGLDPKYKQYFSYYLTKNKKYFQLMAILEEENDDLVALLKAPDKGLGFLNKTFAGDYENRYPYTTGKKLGILTDIDNTPIQEKYDGELELSGSTDEFIAYRDNDFKLKQIGDKIRYRLLTWKDKKYNPPSDCSDGFIGVPGDAEFNQKGFCVAQYEMSWHGLTDVDDSWATYSYYDNGDKGQVVSEAGNSPIAEITQSQAIQECKELGEGYHLITNNEWMTIARNIEEQGQNWSSGTAGNGVLYRGVSNDTTYGCSGKVDGTNRAGPTGSSCNGGKNKLVLSNGNYIYDFAGNVWEHVDRTNDPSRTTAGVGNGNLCGSSGYWYNNGDPADTCQANYGPSVNNVRNGSDKGMGYVRNSSGTDKIFIRGAHASDGSLTGVFTLSLDWTPSYQTRGIGFRCAK